MTTTHTSIKKLWPLVALAAMLVATVTILRQQGRLWICECGHIYLWVGDIWSSDNSQHLTDPYSFTHLLHGVVFFWALALLLPRVSLLWRFVIAIGLEAAWEVAENTEFIINRYREATASLGYNGDTIVNSLGDIAMCGLGFWLAWKIGWRWSLLLFVVVELVLTFWIRDSLLLSILMLVYPLDAIKTWQLGLAP
ncbi:MAG: DUF2585 family protein [Anaerolineae bacterium]